MAGTLHRAGFDLVVWNRDPAKSAAVASELDVRVAGTAAEAVGAAEVVLSSLAHDAALKAVYLGSDGVVEGLGEGVVVVDTSTVYPATIEEVGAAVDATGAGFLDCPVSGSVSVVEAGQLTIMAGGDEALLEKSRPVLDALSSQIVHVGGRGAGAATKLAVNGLVHGLNVALSEALVLAEKAGVDREAAYQVFASGAGGAPFVQYKKEAYLNPDGAAVAFTLDLVAKDLELITGLARKVGAPMAQADTGLEIVQKAVDAGLGQADLSAIAVYLRDQEG